MWAKFPALSNLAKLTDSIDLPVCSHFYLFVLQTDLTGTVAVFSRTLDKYVGIFLDKNMDFFFMKTKAVLILICSVL